MVQGVLAELTERIAQRSRETRSEYLARVDLAGQRGPERGRLSCSNLAHGIAACGDQEKTKLAGVDTANIAIISAYNDMLSAHQPYGQMPDLLKAAVCDTGGVAQFAGGVPAMCDGITQGQEGMELSLFSRDVIALSTAVALSHNMFDGALYLGICDKIVPGLLIGALSFGHLPTVFVPSGPMSSGLANSEKARVRQGYAEGKVDRDELLASESAAYHGPGTCTFYGTANSNQMLMEIMGLHLPGSSFIPPDTPLRNALSRAAAQRVTELAAKGGNVARLADIVDERALVNGIVGLVATGGSTNHTMHLIAIARAAGIQLEWEDFDEISGRTPLLARVYPNGKADVNDFHAAGGVPFLIKTLLQHGLLHENVTTVLGASGLADYCVQPELVGGQLRFTPCAESSADRAVLRSVSDPFRGDGGIRLLTGNLGRGIIKTSAVGEAHLVVEAPVRIFHDQAELESAFVAGDFSEDFIAVVRFQGPRANGMPELHKLTPLLGSLMDQGLKVALVTDGRMSGASGKVPAAIQLSPEAVDGGPLAKLREGDSVRLDAHSGTLECLANDFGERTPVEAPTTGVWGSGRELFGRFRDHVSASDQGASVLFDV